METWPSPASQYRHGRSVAWLIPTRGPVRIVVAAGSRSGGGPMPSGEPGPQTSAPSRARSMPSAWHRRPVRGPGRPRGSGGCRRHRRSARSEARSAARPRRRRPASSAPSMTSPARMQHRLGLPGGLADQVDAEMHAVGEVDVGMAGRAEHHRVARPSGRGTRVKPGRLGPGTPRPRPAARRPGQPGCHARARSRAGPAPRRSTAGRRTRAAAAGFEPCASSDRERSGAAERRRPWLSPAPAPRAARPLARLRPPIRLARGHPGGLVVHVLAAAWRAARRRERARCRRGWPSRRSRPPRSARPGRPASAAARSCPGPRR